MRSYESVAYTTEHRLTKLDLATGEVVDQLDLPDLRAYGLTITGTEGTVRVYDGAGESYRAEDVRIDLESLTIVSREAVEDPGKYREYLWPQG